MRFLIGSILVVTGLLIAFFVGMFSQQSGLLLFAFCSLGVFAYPALVVAIYRVFTGAAGVKVVIERTGSKAAQPQQRRRQSDIDTVLGGAK
jgi:hypothetical protein